MSSQSTRQNNYSQMPEVSVDSDGVAMARPGPILRENAPGGSRTISNHMCDQSKPKTKQQNIKYALAAHEQSYGVCQFP